MDMDMDATFTHDDFDWRLRQSEEGRVEREVLASEWRVAQVEARNSRRATRIA